MLHVRCDSDEKRVRSHCMNIVLGFFSLGVSFFFFFFFFFSSFSIFPLFFALPLF